MTRLSTGGGCSSRDERAIDMWGKLNVVVHTVVLVVGFRCLNGPQRTKSSELGSKVSITAYTQTSKGGGEIDQ